MNLKQQWTKIDIATNKTSRSTIRGAEITSGVDGTFYTWGNSGDSVMRFNNQGAQIAFPNGVKQWQAKFSEFRGMYIRTRGITQALNGNLYMLHAHRLESTVLHVYNLEGSIVAESHIVLPEEAN